MQPRILIFDIESSNLSANFGVILCISYKWLNTGKVHTIAITDFPLFKKDPTNDREVVREFRKVFLQADAVVAHFGQFFDIPMLQTKMIMHGLPVLPKTKLIDTWKIAKKQLKLNSNRLATLISALKIKYKKTELDGPTWVRAMAGNVKAIKYVVTHCIYDVLALEAVFNKLRPLMAESEENFHACKNPTYKSEGIRIKDKKTYRRLYCRKCGWFKHGDL